MYPPSKPVGFHPLAYLARYFDCIEINSTFYAQPRAEHAARWVQLVAAEPAFRFAVKLNAAFTHSADAARRTGRSANQEARAESHDRALDDAALAVEFARGIEPLVRARRLAAVLVQFPISFLFGRNEVRRLGSIRALFPHHPLVLEVRHNSWFTPPALDTVRGLSFSLAYLDLPAAWNHPPEWHTPTGPIGYQRLHGRNSATWFRHDSTRDTKYDYLYEPAEIRRIARMTARLADEHEDVLAITNNHFEGKAVANAIELLAAVRETTVLAPPQLVETYPRLKSVARTDGQQQLF